MDHATRPDAPTFDPPVFTKHDSSLPYDATERPARVMTLYRIADSNTACELRYWTCRRGRAPELSPDSRVFRSSANAYDWVDQRHNGEQHIDPTPAECDRSRLIRSWVVG